MTGQSLLPLATVATSLVAGVVIFFLAERRTTLRSTLNLAAALLKLAFVGWMLWGVFHGQTYQLRIAFLPGLDLLLKADRLALLFLTLSALLWLVTTLYAIGYLEGSPNRSRFFGFFSLCVMAATGIALAGNLLTFFVFYELLTLVTYPLVVHRGTDRALSAGRNYLAYTIAGGALVLAGMAWLYGLTGTLEFTDGGIVKALAAERHAALAVIFALLIAGLGVKSALVPLHGWLPKAMVAPAPVSALLHAVAVVKAGAFGIVRVVFDIFGIEFASSLGVLAPLAALSAATILYGSLRALVQDDLKRLLAYSTISQISYIVLGVALASPLAVSGGLSHLVHQGIMKITLFFCAGNYAETLGVHRISEMAGIGRRMPWTTATFSVAALGMIGLPPTAGFITKWTLGLGALQAGAPWVLGLLVVSSLLNAAYFLPVLHAAWFREPSGAWPDERIAAVGRRETAWLLLLPALATGVSTLLVGLLAGVALSPLGWAGLISEREFRR